MIINLFDDKEDEKEAEDIKLEEPEETAEEDKSDEEDGQMHGARTGFHVYEDCRGILQRNPAVHPDKGFAQIDQEWIARFFR